ncbi:TetR/AcrR family transcriptional regulator [Maritalea mediterranea]|uniref:TetR/AcrR family transcriptional regulator n=1 Tax=Maritalea mediterranea TaxID=2909667 RepID=A0ABS9E6I2_9HYPH|nr:TetR/AcrR family transcriptional regulator [Maritalea mediterranea]MCF4097822.1 TetR/AcrR family transcriptional regulator [Maritalea mediterranea]
MARHKSFHLTDAYEILLDRFWRHGLSSMSVKGMADCLGLTRSSFYNAFGSREALLQNLVLYYEVQSPQIALVVAEPPIDVKYLFTALIREMCVAHRADPDRKGCLLTNLAIETRDNEPALRKLLLQINADRIARLIEICLWAVAAKDLPRTTDCEKHGHQLFALLEQINLLARTLPTCDPLEEIALTQLARLGLYAEGEGELEAVV